MAKIINIEKSKYINDNIEIYAANKIGQYSKFLDKTPIFVTYYSINQTMSRADAGTGGIQSELGLSSPIRFNKINNIPVYNMPELKPDVNYNETGFDVDLDLSGITLLPGTVKPASGDYMLISLPGTIEFLFRVNNFAYNSIQSNDFYLIDLDLKDTGTNLEELKMPNQIVETYETIFENIGTQDKCFIRTTNVPKIEAIGKLFLEMKEFYYNTFYDSQNGCFVLRDNKYDEDSWFYDMYLEKFIMNSEIYYEDNSAKSMMLTCNDLATPQTRSIYTKTLLYGVLTRTKSYLSEDAYYYQRGITRLLSPFVINNQSTNGPEIVFTENPTSNIFLNEYYSNDLILAIKYPDGIYPGDNITVEGYTPHAFVPVNYLEEIIYHYMLNQTVDIDKEKVIPFMVRDDIIVFHYMPLIIYIVLQYYNGYFEKIEL